MATDEFDADAFVAAAAALIELEIAPAYLAGVAENVRRVRALAMLVAEHPLAPEDEPAPVFEP